jgi:hypothetical protein
VGDRKAAFRVLIGIAEGNKQLEMPRLMCKYDILMDLQEVRRGVWTTLIWLRIGAGGVLL